MRPMIGDGMPEMNVRSMKALSLLWTICCASLAAAPSANSAEPIKIGAVLPFSGGVELYGRQAKLGLDLAAKDINAAGRHSAGRSKWSMPTTRPIRRSRPT